MAASFSLPTVLANLAAGNQALSLIDGDFTACYNPLVALNTFSNYYTDVGAANAYAITVSSPQTVSQAAGLPIQFIATNANTGASTLQINALAVKSIVNQDGSALFKGQIVAGAVISVIYDGTHYQLQGNPQTAGTFTPTLVGSGGGAPTYTTETGNYTVIGDRVFFSLQITISGVNTLLGNVTIQGMPLTSSEVGAVSISINNNQSNVIARAELSNGAGVAAPTMSLYKTIIANTALSVAADLQASWTIIATGHYKR